MVVRASTLGISLLLSTSGKAQFLTQPTVAETQAATQLIVSTMQTSLPSGWQDFCILYAHYQPVPVIGRVGFVNELWRTPQTLPCLPPTSWPALAIEAAAQGVAREGYYFCVYDPNDPENRRQVLTFREFPLCCLQPYGLSNPARLTASGSSAPGGTVTFGFSTPQGPSAQTFLLFSPAATNTQFPGAGTLLLATFYWLVTVPAGPASGQFLLNIPNESSLIGSDLFAQAAMVSPTTSPLLSNGIVVNVD